MESLGLCILAVLNLGACATDVSNNAVLNKPNQTHKIATHYPVDTVMLNIYTRAYSNQFIVELMTRQTTKRKTQ